MALYNYKDFLHILARNEWWHIWAEIEATTMLKQKRWNTWIEAITKGFSPAK